MTNSITNLDQQLPQYVRGYITNPRETFNCELKPWVNPSVNDYDKVKIAKACLALRNKGGGALLIGISNGGELLNLPDAYDPDVLFTQDTVQAIVSSYSAQQFGVDVYHVPLNEPLNSRVVAIVVPGGITTPTLCKKDSRTDRDQKVKKGMIYTRTVESNGTISSAPASQQDMEDITKMCFDNRVADIGQFLRDHLTYENIHVLKHVVGEQGADRIRDHQQELDEFAASSAEAFKKFHNKDGGD
jgi:predicted HTH transcriptional regulator